MASRIGFVAVAVTLLVLLLAPAAEARKKKDPSSLTIFQGKFNVTTTIVTSGEPGKTVERKECWGVLSRKVTNFTSMYPGNITVIGEGEIPTSQRRLQMHFYGRDSGAIMLGPVVPYGAVDVDDKTSPVETFLRYNLEPEADPRRKSAKGPWKDGDAGGMYELTASVDEISIILMDTVNNEIRRMNFVRTGKRKTWAGKNVNVVTLVGLVVGTKLLQFGLKRVFREEVDDKDPRAKKTN